MAKYRKKPVEIEAVQWNGTFDGAKAIARWAEDKSNATLVVSEEDGDLWFTIETLEGSMTVTPGDFVICGVKGEFYPCKPDIFEETYEPSA